MLMPDASHSSSSSARAAEAVIMLPNSHRREPSMQAGQQLQETGSLTLTERMQFRWIR